MTESKTALDWIREGYDAQDAERKEQNKTLKSDGTATDPAMQRNDDLPLFARLAQGFREIEQAERDSD